MNDTRDSLMAALREAGSPASSVSLAEHEKVEILAYVYRIAPQGAVMVKRHSTRTRALIAISGVSAATAAVVPAVLLTASGSPAPVPAAIGSGTHTSAPSVATLKRLTSDAILTAAGDDVLTETTDIEGAGGALTPDYQVKADSSDGEGAITQYGANGQPGTVVAQTAPGTVEVFDYGLHEWWTTTSFPAAKTNGGSAAPAVSSPFSALDATANAINNGNMTVTATDQTVDGRTTTEFSGNDTGVPGYGLSIWVSSSTNLPVKAVSTDSNPQYGYPDGITTVSQYQWQPANSVNASAVAPTVPSGFTEVSGPPAQTTPTGPGLG